MHLADILPWAANSEIEAGLRAMLGHGEFKLTKHDQEPRKRFGVTVKLGKAFDLAVLAS